jgi:AcrR family transcriptional regulator
MNRFSSMATSDTKKRAPKAANAAKTGVVNRREDILVAAAELFRTKGFEGATMRDIASAVDMLSGSVFYHFESKEELFFAVYESGIAQITQAVRSAVAGQTDPWARLEAACVAHLRTLLKSPFSAAVAPSLSQVAVRLRPTLIKARNEYDDMFKAIIDALPLSPAINRKLMRLQILGALNWTPYWYKEGKTSVDQIARHLILMLRQSAEGAVEAPRKPRSRAAAGG